MKKLLLCAVACAVFNASDVAAKIVTVDSIKILKESEEGKQLLSELEAKARDIQKKVKDAQQDFLKFQEEISKESGLQSVSNQEELTRKTQELQRKKRNLEQTIAAEEQEFNEEVQTKQIALSNKQRQTYKDLKKEHADWDIVMDVNTPGVFAFDEKNDVTQLALKKVNTTFQAEQARIELTNNTNKDMTVASNDDKTKVTKVDAATLNAAIKKQSTPKTA